MNLLENILKKKEWDSNFWNFNIANIETPSLTQKLLDKTFEICHLEKISFIQYLCSLKDLSSISLCEQNGFHFADLKVSYKLKLSQRKKTLKNLPFKDFAIRKATLQDSESLFACLDMVEFPSRYYNDAHFDRKKVKLFYKTWIQNSLLKKIDDEVYLLYINNLIIGFCSLRYLENNSCQIGLIGIRKLYQGKNIGFYFLQEIIKILASNKIKDLTVITQGGNLAAQRLYQKSGFFIQNMEIWFHKWILDAR